MAAAVDSLQLLTRMCVLCICALNIPSTKQVSTFLTTWTILTVVI